MASNNMYRVGDYVFFETSATAPYQIRRIEELNKTPTGAVEAKVTCFYRRRDISSTLVQLADRHQNYFEEEEDYDGEVEVDSSKATTDTPVAMETNHTDDSPATDTENNCKTPAKSVASVIRPSRLLDSEKRELRLREVFLSRQMEILPATHIRGKCSVRLVNETEGFGVYVSRCDSFFYQLVYDPSQKTLLADRGEIRIGSRWQAEVPKTQPVKLGPAPPDYRLSSDLEARVWQGCDLPISNDKVDEFILLARSVGTLARAYESSSAIRQSSIVKAAASASRDITTQTALNLLHQAKYDFSEAISLLLPGGQPLLCSDELESWTASEGNLFEEAMEKYGKEFHDIRTDFLPWKSPRAIVEYYAMWKTTERTVQQRSEKATEAEGKLKQVYIPNYNRPNPAVLYNRADVNSKGCESCLAVSSPQWYAWGPPNLFCRLCANCWTYWKKYGGLKNQDKIDRMENNSTVNNGICNRSSTDSSVGQVVGSFPCSQPDCDKEFRLKQQLYKHLAIVHGLNIPRSDSVLTSDGGMRGANSGGIMRPRGGHLLHTSAFVRLARALCARALKVRRLARRPGLQAPLTIQQVREEGKAQLDKLKDADSLLKFRMKFRPLDEIVVGMHKQLKLNGAVSDGVVLTTNLPSFLRRDTPFKLKASTKLNFPVDDQARLLHISEATSASESISISPKNDWSSRLLTSSRPSIMKKRDWTSATGATNATGAVNGQSPPKRQLMSTPVANGNSVSPATTNGKGTSGNNSCASPVNLTSVNNHCNDNYQKSS